MGVLACMPINIRVSGLFRATAGEWAGLPVGVVRSGRVAGCCYQVIVILD